MAAAGWHPDPAQRYVQRYFDGERWTHWVIDTQGNQGTDPTPIETAPPPPPGGPVPYGYAYNPYAGAPQTNGMAIASLVLGILWIWWIGSILAIVFGFVAKSQIRQANGGQSGGGMATAGIVLGFVGIAALVLVIIVAIASYDESNYAMRSLLG